MPEAVDVGSVLGNRYRVTAHILASARQDLVLDGMDQVLNRPVSILAASEGNADQVVESARELATGERTANLQVLDLLTTDEGTYLVTGRTPAADLLDLVVRQDDPAAEEPYVEPFFTDTLGSEIFGGPRPTELDTVDDDEEDDREEFRWSGLAGLKRRFGRRQEDQHEDEPLDAIGGVDDEPSDDSTSVEAAPQSTAQISARPTSHRVPPPPTHRPGTYRGETQAESIGRPAVVAGTAGAAVSGSSTGTIGAPDGTTSGFPFFDDDEVAASGGAGDNVSDDEQDRNTGGPGGFSPARIVTGVILSVVLVISVILVVTQLGSIFAGTEAADNPAQQNTGATAAQTPTSVPETASAAPEAATVDPVIAGISRVVPDNPGLDAGNDADLPRIIDGDPDTFWGNQVYASDTFGGLAGSLSLVVELEESSTISDVTIEQLNGSGGSFSVLVNDEPTLDGAEEIAQGSFSAPTVEVPIEAGDAGQPTGRYVIVNVTQLPRLSDIQAQYPYGLRIAEIDVR